MSETPIPAAAGAPSSAHIPVLVEKVIEALAPVEGAVIVDGTYGGGGYSRAVLAVANCTVLAVDRDPEAMERAWAHAGKDSRLVPAAGCFGELCVDVPGLVRRFAPRIHFVHLRNMRGRPDDFMETFPDDGDVDLVGTLAALDEVGFGGYARPDHSPRLATEMEGTPGYGFDGHLFTLGYLRGVMDGLKRERTP